MILTFVNDFELFQDRTEETLRGGTSNSLAALAGVYWLLLAPKVRATVNKVKTIVGKGPDGVT